MSRQVARPALVPLAMAVGVPLGLLQISALAAALSLPVSVLLAGLAFVMGHETRRNAQLSADWAQVALESDSSTQQGSGVLW